MGPAGKQWWRNVRDVPDVAVLHRGVWRRARARIVRGDRELAALYARRFRSAGRQLTREANPVFVVLSLTDEVA
jgi:hypothetical protein